MDWPKMRRAFRRIWIAAGLTFTAWMAWSLQAHGVDQDVLVSDAEVSVKEGDGFWRFAPISSEEAAGLVFLPGGMVDPKAYFPLARSLDVAGHPVVVVGLPFRMARSPASERAVLETARSVLRETDGASVWVLGGHSRGAAIATRLIARSTSDFDGLALIGTTHPRIDLSQLTLPVLKIGGTNDCVAPRERSEESSTWLPADTQWEWIEGANHSQFGWYGAQLMDCSADITRERQQDETHALLVRFLKQVGDAS